MCVCVSSRERARLSNLSRVATCRFAIVCVMDGTKIQVIRKSGDLNYEPTTGFDEENALVLEGNAGDVIFVRGDVIHRGLGYEKFNVRVHVYMAGEMYFDSDEADPTNCRIPDSLSHTFARYKLEDVAGDLNLLGRLSELKKGATGDSVGTISELESTTKVLARVTTFEASTFVCPITLAVKDWLGNGSLIVCAWQKTNFARIQMVRRTLPLSCPRTTHFKT